MKRVLFKGREADYIQRERARAEGVNCKWDMLDTIYRCETYLIKANKDGRLIIIIITIMLE